ncbi:protein of unknown function [Shewanella benthica]|uniref:Uncharacterized protein n=1 Tax=Shewanella benthica TaxID=43661 RepID=A0A330M480_9GAMM|nr:protein of unknown function [Shewanella benthica]
MHSYKRCLKDDSSITLYRAAVTLGRWLEEAYSTDLGFIVNPFNRIIFKKPLKRSHIKQCV